MTKRSTNRSKAAPGRPRDPETTASILRAALDLAEERGFDSLSVEGVAARAGVATPSTLKLSNPLSSARSQCGAEDRGRGLAAPRRPCSNWCCAC